jgi:hypothetical protein
MDPIKEAELRKLNAEIAKIEEETLQLKNLIILLSDKIN